MTYREVAARLNVELCTGCDSVINHADGAAELDARFIHWQDRRLNRFGLRTFLKLVGAIDLQHGDAQPRWQKLYEMNTFATRTALDQFRVRIPRHYSASDRAWVSWYAHHHPDEVPARVRRWANRKG